MRNMRVKTKSPLRSIKPRTKPTGNNSMSRTSLSMISKTPRKRSPSWSKNCRDNRWPPSNKTPTPAEARLPTAGVRGVPVAAARPPSAMTPWLSAVTDTKARSRNTLMSPSRLQSPKAFRPRPSQHPRGRDNPPSSKPLAPLRSKPQPRGRPPPPPLASLQPPRTGRRAPHSRERWPCPAVPRARLSPGC